MNRTPLRRTVDKYISYLADIKKTKAGYSVYSSYPWFSSELEIRSRQVENSLKQKGFRGVRVSYKRSDRFGSIFLITTKG
jgi:hypothetical protein